MLISILVAGAILVWLAVALAVLFARRNRPRCKGCALGCRLDQQTQSECRAIEEESEKRS